MVIYIRLQWWAGDPLSTLIGKAMVGILIAFFLITSALYWTNAYKTQKFPILMTELYNASGNKYYKEYSVTRLTSFRIASHALLFAAISTGLVEVLTKHGSWLFGGYGEYFKMAEGFLKNSGGTHSSSSHSGSGHGQSEGGYGEYIKMAKGLMKHSSGGGHGESGGGGPGGYGEYFKMAEGFLKK